MSDPPATRPSLRPLLKWTGGKRQEIPFLKSSYPPGIRRIIEPFSGGAAVSFDLNPDQVVLNDLSDGLVRFYRTIQDASARKEMLIVLAALDVLRKKMAARVSRLSDTEVDHLFLTPEPAWDSLIQDDLAVWVSILPPPIALVVSLDIQAQAISKTARRIPALEARRSERFSIAARRQHLETGMQAGLYTAMRRLYNSQVQGVSPHWMAAAWWFVRALCYSGMFRYGKNGNFNVPYGGIAYNSRDFAKSIQQLSSRDIVDFFARTEIFELDFQALFERHSYFGPGDFIFVDPPYDSTFSQYNHEGSFGPDDQRRLASTLANTTAPWMLVIKNTPFILSLYQSPDLSRGVFGKQYQVNFRNRHDRAVEHLVVANYPLTYVEPGQVGLQRLD